MSSPAMYSRYPPLHRPRHFRIASRFGPPLLPFLLSFLCFSSFTFPRHRLRASCITSSFRVLWARWPHFEFQTQIPRSLALIWQGMHTRHLSCKGYCYHGPKTRVAEATSNPLSSYGITPSKDIQSDLPQSALTTRILTTRNTILPLSSSRGLSPLMSDWPHSRGPFPALDLIHTIPRYLGLELHSKQSWTNLV
ncbi:hypothetical protein F4775DRAFT_167941 [Biscogniauxia sp. FL1348]|nr:hypothetical protein F4775DRAFT_167941 [Biscogniauxia sp. FL1348]